VREAARGVVKGPMRAIFLTYLLLIVAGLTCFTIIGLTHH
jgi:hypothetical protein